MLHRWTRRLLTAAPPPVLRDAAAGSAVPEVVEPDLVAPACSWAPIGPVRFGARPRQGRLGDCWLLAPLLAVHAVRRPFLIASLRDVPGKSAAGSAAGPETDLAEVRLFRRGTPYWVRVRRTVPVDAQGRAVFATERHRLRPGWPSLLEKAAAIGIGTPGTASYATLRRGLAGEGFRLLTGIPAPLRLDLPDVDEIAHLLTAKHALVASTHPLAPLMPHEGLRFAPMHVYAVVGADPRAGTVRISNPWGHNGARPPAVSIPGSVLRSRFASMNVTSRPIPVR